ncbi:TenA family protein [Sulfitobacter guttiformis]|uniref:Thiaminase/transcriptional activator TenA n=1 Tax=Sulfitobacter guttiformis TaxID=74349 RepID=A0A420DQM5_9RHOB|nr:TenA family protein [Sulfitobacter guttiformis]KIN73910.1 Transcriptional regulator [Sulfitobacter guttiformis KCTC 32187]RKE96542.1 thiaminase/transcriptional activator TenA [Sulfitobacter guttiformis]
MSAPDYGDTFAVWRAGAGNLWTDYTCHAFVKALGEGVLPQANYLHYLRQDYVFLIHFARAWALAAAKADTYAEMAAASATVYALIHIEMPLHVQTCEAHGIDRATLEATPEAAGNLAYTRYVLEAGYSGDFLDLLAALAPCVLGYGEIGLRLKGTTGPYAPWCASYGSDEYQALCRDVGALLDGAMHRRLGGEWRDLPRAKSLQSRFTTATQLEIGFWDMAQHPDRT